MKTIRFMPILAAGLALAALAAKPASAAPGPALPILGGPNSIVFGGYFPNDHDASRGGSTQFDVDFRYGIPLPNLVTPTRTIVSLAGEFGAHDGKHNTIVPLTVSQIVSLNGGSPFAPGAVYVGAGVGAYLMNQSGISSTVRVGGLLNAGYNITDAIFLDAKYQFVTHGDGAIAAIGLRF